MYIDVDTWEAKKYTLKIYSVDALLQTPKVWMKGKIKMEK